MTTPQEGGKPAPVQELFDEIAAAHPVHANTLTHALVAAEAIFRAKIRNPQTSLEGLAALPPLLVLPHGERPSYLTRLRKALITEENQIAEADPAEVITGGTLKVGEPVTFPKDSELKSETPPSRPRTRKPFSMPYGFVKVTELAQRENIGLRTLQEYLAFVPGRRTVSARYGVIVPEEAATALIPQLKDELAEMQRDKQRQREQQIYDKAERKRENQQEKIRLAAEKKAAKELATAKRRVERDQAIATRKTEREQVRIKKREAEQAKREQKRLAKQREAAERREAKRFKLPEGYGFLAKLAEEFSIPIAKARAATKTLISRKYAGSYGFIVPEDVTREILLELQQERSRKRIPKKENRRKPKKPARTKSKEPRRQKLKEGREGEAVRARQAELVRSDNESTLAELCKKHGVTISTGRRIVGDLASTQASNSAPKIYNTQEADAAFFADSKKKADQQSDAATKRIDLGALSLSGELAQYYGLSTKGVEDLLVQLPTESRSGRRYDTINAVKILESYLLKRSQRSGVHIAEGKTFVNLLYINKRFRVSYHLLNSLIRGNEAVPTATGMRDATVYGLDEALDALRPYITLPTANKTSGISTDPDGHSRAPLNIFIKQSGLHADLINKLAEGLDFIDMRSSSGTIVDGYRTDLLESRIEAYLAVPDQTERLVDAALLAELYGVTISTVRKHLLEVRIKIGRSYKYPEDTAMQLMDRRDEQKKQSQKVADRKRRVPFTSREGLISREVLFEESGLSLTQFRDAMRGVPLRKDAQSQHYYPGADARARIQEYKATQQVKEQEARGIVVHEGKRHISIGALRKDGATISTRTLKKILAHLETIPGKVSYVKDPVDLFPEDEARAIIAAWKPYADRMQRQGATYWESLPEDARKAELETRAREYVEVDPDSNRLTDTVMGAQGSIQLSRAITAYYPDGLIGMRSKLGISHTVQVQTNWDKEPNPVATIQKRVRELISRKPDFTSTDINNMGLWEAVRDRYPGGYNQLRLDHGLKIKRVTAGSITPESIQAEVALIIANEGGFSGPIAKRIGAEAVMSRANTNYPGGLQQLLEDMGLERSKKQWTEAIIEAEALKIYEAEGRVSDSLLKQTSGLRMAVYRKYEGGLQRLKERLEELAESQEEESS